MHSHAFEDGLQDGKHACAEFSSSTFTYSSIFV